MNPEADQSEVINLSDSEDNAEVQNYRQGEEGHGGRDSLVSSDDEEEREREGSRGLTEDDRHFAMGVVAGSNRNAEADGDDREARSPIWMNLARRSPSSTNRSSPADGSGSSNATSRSVPINRVGASSRETSLNQAFGGGQRNGGGDAQGGAS